MRLSQLSFSRGEITPLLRVRVDLAAYYIGLSYILNMYLLAQGGATRRPPFVRLGNAAMTSGTACPVRLIEFIYNRDDAMVIELYNRAFRVWQRSTRRVVASGTSPFRVADLPLIKFAQSGNVVFMTHKDYPIQMLTRHSLGDWEFTEFEFKNGPWMPDRGSGDIKLTVQPPGRYNYAIKASGGDYFTADMVGSLIELNYTIEKNEITGKSLMAPDEYISESVEVGAEWNLLTFNKWRGEISIQKSSDLGETWFTIRDLERQNPSEEANFNVSGSETDTNILYRIRAQHESGSGPISFSFTASGFVKSNIFKITEFIDERQVLAVWQEREVDASGRPVVSVETKDWRLGAWGGASGYPACAVFYQGRFVLAGSKAQPQTVWMSKIDDFGDFGVSSPLRDDDAINISLSADDVEGIHSLLALSDLIAFTGSGEWRIKGAGDNGAIAPNAVVAHRQDTIGSAPIQPMIVSGDPVLVQTHRIDVHVLKYLMDMDGYSGSNMSVLSNHLFCWKTEKGSPPADRRVLAMAYQKVPDCLIWFFLADGTAVTCTYMAEHEVVAWARQETSGFIGGGVCIPGDGYDELWMPVKRDGVWGIEVLARRDAEESFLDPGGRGYESCMKTLRINLDSQGISMQHAKKLISRLAISTVRSVSAWVAPASDADRVRRRRIDFDYSEEPAESDIQLNAGFERGAAVQIWTDENAPLTICDLLPQVTPGGG